MYGTMKSSLFAPYAAGAAAAGRKFYRGCGCSNCFGTGYRDRVGVFEILVMNRRLRAAVSRGAQMDELQKILDEEGSFVSLEENSQRLISEGITTIDEVRRIISSAALE